MLREISPGLWHCSFRIAALRKKAGLCKEEPCSRAHVTGLIIARPAGESCRGASVSLAACWVLELCLVGSSPKTSWGHGARPSWGCCRKMHSRLSRGPELPQGPPVLGRPARPPQGPTQSGGAAARASASMQQAAAVCRAGRGQLDAALHSPRGWPWSQPTGCQSLGNPSTMPRAKQRAGAGRSDTSVQQKPCPVGHGWGRRLLP